MKTIVLGDTHGRSFWRSITQTEKADEIIFIGDYFDSRDGISAAEQIHNFKEIVEFKKANPENVILLIGNHDMSYWPGINGAVVSGYQVGAAANITQVLIENKEHLQMAYDDGQFLYTHAGVSKVWLENNGWTPETPIDVFVNNMWLYKPLSFEFTGWDPHGDSETQGPTWIRPKSLLRSWQKEKWKPAQVVGHTQVVKIDLENYTKWTGGKLLMIDTLGTSGEYLIITDGELSVGKII